MALLLRVVEGVFVDVLPVRATAFRGPGGVCDPVVVEDRPFEGFATGAGEVNFL